MILTGCLLLFSLLVIIIGKKTNDSLLAPNRIIPLMWVLLIIIPCIFWNTNYAWNGKGLFWLMLAMISMELGGIVCGDKKIRCRNPILPLEFEDRVFNSDSELDKGRVMEILVLILILLGLFGVVGQMYLAGYSINNFLSFESWVKMNEEVAYNRYYGETETSIFTQLLISFEYLAALAGGYAFNFSKRKKHKLLCIATFFPIVLNMFYANTKSGFISNIILWFSGWCISRIWLTGGLPRITPKMLILALTGFLVFSIIMILVMVLRTGDFSSEMFLNRIDEFFVYAFGGTAGFDYWFTNGTDLNNYDMGANTYMSISKYIGYSKLDNYENFFKGLGNIYTAFRGVIMDFGKVGGLIFCFLRGFVSQITFNSVAAGDSYPFLSMSVLMCMYFWGIYSFLISSWRYTSYIILIVFFVIFLFVFHKKVLDVLQYHK